MLNNKLDNKNLTQGLTLGALPASTKIYVPSERFSDVKVAMRRISLTEKSDRKFFDVYDT